jgi:class 3 adenylate cyclase
VTAVSEERAARRTAPLLERDEERSELAALLDDAQHGRGRLLLIEGQAGIGKTQLLGELENLADADGTRALSARGSELERDFAFGVVRQLLEPLRARASAEERARLLDGVAGLAEPVFAASSPEPSSDPAYGTLRGLYWLLANAAEENPLVLAIDDLQSADEPSLRFLHFLARRLEGMTVGVVVAARQEGSEFGSELLNQLKLEAPPPVLRPAPLSDSAVGTLVHARLGPHVSSALSTACYTSTWGNPFLLDELVTELSRGATPVDQLDPRAVRGFASRRLATAVLMRIERIGPSAPAFAQAATALGERANIAQAAELAGIDAGEGRSLARSLVDAEILEGIEPPRFVHALVQSAIYEEIPASDRAALHARAAKLLARAGADPESIAAHLVAADPADDAEAVTVLRAAATTALSRGAPDVAARYLRRALAEPPPDADRIPVIGELGTAASLDGDPEGLDHLRMATAEAEPGPLRADLALRLANALIPRGEIAEAAAAIEEAIVEVPESERERSLALGATLAALSNWAQSTYTSSERRNERLASLAGADSRSGRMILAVLAYEHALQARPASDALTLATAALEGGLLSDERSDHASVCDAICVTVYAERFELAAGYVAAALAEARRTGRVAEVVLLLSFGAVLAYRRGRIASAEAQAREALEVAELGTFATGTVMFTAASLSACLIEQGKLKEAQQVLESAGSRGAVPDNVMAAFLLFAQGGLHLAGGNAEAAVSVLREVANRARGWMDQTFLLPYRSLLALGLVQLGEVAEARQLAAEELELARAWGTPGVIGAAQRIAGLLADRESGIELLREAVATLEGSGAKLEHAHALVDLGTALHRAGKRNEARERLAQGLELADGCGAIALVEMAEAELRAAGARPRRRALSGVGSLTPSELRVAEMATEGMTNKEIAQALFVTLRTVETHLSHAYGKLEISSRDQLPKALGRELRGPAGASLPQGVVTFLLTDVEGSSRLWEEDPEAMRAALALHDQAVEHAVAATGGVRPVEQGEGDSAVVAFSEASRALVCALELQRELAATKWPERCELSVRVALHTGEALLRDPGNYVGPALNRCARLRALAHGGQTLLSRATYELVADQLPDGAGLTSLGPQRLKNLERAEEVFELAHPELPSDFPPLRSFDVLPNNLPL